MISAPYTFEAAENVLISSSFSVHSDWYNSVFDKIKDNIRVHLRGQQNNRCCYCHNELSLDIKGADIEHIIPKSEIEAFTFHEKNLALSCPACNTIKHRKSVFKSIKKIPKRYPKNSDNIKIIHPHYDEYLDNIEVLSGSIYVALTAKGSETITMCELYRLRVVEEKAKEYKANENYIAKMVEEIRQGGENIDKFAEFLCSLSIAKKSL